MLKSGALVVSLVAIAAAAAAQGAFGEEFIAVAFTTLVPLGAAVAVIQTGKPLPGLLAAGWLALGPVFMPYVADDLSDPNKVGLVTSTVVYLVAIGLAILSGAAAQREHARRAKAKSEQADEHGGP
jgi:hypothetical protein